jgi:hypothetical protein
MSFDLNLIGLKDGGPADFPASIVREALGPFIQSRDGDFCILAFPDGGGGEMNADDEDAEFTNGVTISRASGEDVYNSLYEILRQTHSVLIWSFGGCVIADSSVMNDLPEGLVESVGEPILVRSGAEIAAAVRNS